MVTKIASSLLLVTLISTYAAALWAAEIAVIVNPASGVQSMTREEVSHIFLGRLKQLPSGEAARACDNEHLRELFYRSLVGKGLAEINAYWARLKFSGRTQPPQLLQGGHDVLEYVAREPGAIGYVEASQVDKRVRTVLKIED